MKKCLFLSLAIIMLCLFTACNRNLSQSTEPPTTTTAAAEYVKPEDIAGKTYLYEKDGFYGPFTITLNEDGTMSYYVGYASSYIGLGTWTLEEDILTITDRPNGNLHYENCFRVEDGALVFLAEGSTGFMYIEVTEGDRFYPKDVSADAQEDA